MKGEKIPLEANGSWSEKVMTEFWYDDLSLG